MTVEKQLVPAPQSASPQPVPVKVSAAATISGGIPVGGRVRGVDKAPVAGAAVTLISLEGRPLGRSVTQADGSYGMEAPSAGSYVLIASADGYQPQARRWSWPMSRWPTTFCSAASAG
jgi:hypothetical protein